MPEQEAEGPPGAEAQVGKAWDGLQRPFPDGL